MTKTRNNSKIINKNVKKPEATVKPIIKKNHVVPSEMMTMPKEKLNFLLPLLPPKKRCALLHGRLLAISSSAAAATNPKVHKTPRSSIPISKRKQDSGNHENQDGKDRTPKFKRLRKGLRTAATGPDLPEEYKQIILSRLNGKKLTLLIERRLDASDVKCDKSILSLPRDEILSKNVLEPDEIESLDRDSTLTFSLIDPKCLEWWSMSKEKDYLPKTNWNEIVEQNNLVIGDVVQFWSFRADNDKLHLALLLVKRGENQNGHGKNCRQERTTSLYGSEDSASAGSTVCTDRDE